MQGKMSVNSMANFNSIYFASIYSFKEVLQFLILFMFLQAIWVASVHSCVTKFSHHVFHLAPLHAAIKDSRQLPSSL